MAEPKVYKSLIKYVGPADPIKTAKGLKQQFKHTLPNYKDPSKEFSAGVIESEESDALLMKMLELEPGKQYCMHTIKNEQGFYDLVDLTQASDAPKPGESNSKYGNKGGNNYTPKDDSGQAVGGAWRFTIDTMRDLVDMPKFKSLKEAIDAIEEGANIILDKTVAKTEELKAKNKAKAASESKAKEEKPLSRMEQLKLKKEQEKREASPLEKAKKAEPKEDLVEPDMQDDDLDDVKFHKE